jgi:ATP-dependent helicase/nuclease subunit B
MLAYLLDSNTHLKRALRTRARRWHNRWSYADGLVELSADGLEALKTQLPTARAYSPTALQNYAACPYKFVLQAVHRLSPREVPEAIDSIDPLSRGAMIHEVQFRLLSALSKASALPLTAEGMPAAHDLLAAVLSEVAAKWRDDLAPAIDGVWDDCIAAVQGDLREWLRRVSEEKVWTPWRFELAFGLADEKQRDENSTREPVRLDEGLLLRGSIDLVERAQDGSLRATDYKTGKAWAKEGVVIGGGGTLQPALYALVLEKLFPQQRVEGGRLYYCTYAGDFTPVEVPLDAAARGSVKLLAQTLAHSVETGFLPAAPREKECARCDYLPVCGPDEERRTKRKPRAALVPLTTLREQK